MGKKNTHTIKACEQEGERRDHAELTRAGVSEGR